MSVKNKLPKDTIELQQTLITCKHIEEVYFTETGEHFFSKHELVDKGKKTGKFYGRLSVEYQEYKTDGTRKYFKPVSIHTPEALIVETLSREEVLAIKVAVEKETAAPSADVLELVSLVKNLQSEIAELKAAKGGKKADKKEEA
jgi:hypothetical protein